VEEKNLQFGTLDVKRKDGNLRRAIREGNIMVERVVLKKGNLCM
jgi:hypothetical protein